MKITTKVYIKEYLGIEDLQTIKDKKILLVNEQETNEEYLNKLTCFFNLLKDTYIKDGIILYIINAYLLTFDYKFIEIKSLYDYAEINNLSNICKYLSDFLTTFQFSLEADTYKKSESYEKISNSFYENFNRREFYGNGKYISESLDYCIDFILNKDLIYDYNFFFEKLNKLYKREIKNKKYIQIFDFMLSKNKFLPNLFDFDYDHIQHKKIYNDYIQYNVQESDINAYKFDTLLRLLKNLDKNNMLEEKTFVRVLNQIIIEINKIVQGYNDDIENSIRYVSNVEQIIEAIVKVKECTEYYKKYEDNIEQCIHTVLLCKRHYVKSENIDNGLHVMKHEFELDKRLLNAIQKDLTKDFQLIYKYLQKDFDNELEQGIRSFSEFPLLDLVSRVSINKDQGTYLNWSNDFDTVFSNYYNEKGRQISSSLKDELQNVYHGNYYYLMMSRLSNSFTISGNIIAVSLKKLINDNLESYICKKVLGVTEPCYHNDYILCVYLILIVEQSIYIQMKNAGLKFIPKNMNFNVGELFNYYKDNKFARNVCMFVNYVLYDEYGLKYRNNFMHGNFIHKTDLTIELLYVFSCVIGLKVLENKYGG